MSTDDEAARKRKAEQLRAQISRYKKKEDAGEDTDAGGDTESCASEEAAPESHAGKSPRQFVEERMREIDKEDQ